jgi:hypothetical protein
MSVAGRLHHLSRSPEGSGMYEERLSERSKKRKRKGKGEGVNGRWAEGVNRTRDREKPLI